MGKYAELLEKEKIAKTIYRQELQLFAYIQMLNRDGIMINLFSAVGDNLKESYDHHPGKDIRRHFENKSYVLEVLHFFEKYDSHLIDKEWKRGVDHCELHMILKAGIKYCELLLKKLG